MAINERLIDTEVAAAGNGGGLPEAEQGLILHLDANDVDSYDGDGAEWVDISTFDKTIPISDNEVDLDFHIDPTDPNSYSGSGNTIIDIAGDATVTKDSGIDYDTDNGGYFDKTNTEDITTNYSPDNLTEFTAEVWINPNSVTQNVSSVLTVIDSFNNNALLIMYLRADQRQIQFSTYYGGTSFVRWNPTGDTSVQYNKWQHLVMTCKNNGKMVIYLDGEVKQTLDFPHTMNTSVANLEIGHIPSNSTYGFYGKMGAVRFYSKQLSASDIGQNYRHGRDTVYTELIPDTNLELHLDPTSYSGSGSTWTADTGSNATITNASYDQELGDFFDLDGSGDFIDTNNTHGYITQTHEIWVKADIIQRQYIVSNYGSGTIPQGAIYFEMTSSGTIQAGVRNSSGLTSSLTTSTALSANKWYHLCCTSDGSNLKFYINGELDSTQSATVNTLASNSQNLIIGYDPRNIRLYLNGQVGQFRTYSSALTQDQIRQNYNFTKPSYPNGYDGTLEGLTSSDWNPDGYFTFDGYNDYLHPVGFRELYGNFTFHMKLKATHTSGENSILASTTNNFSAQEGIVFSVQPTGTFFIGFSDGSTKFYEYTSAANTILNNTWHDFVVVQSLSGYIAVYVDGVEINKATVSNFTESSYRDLLIGTYGEGYTLQRFKGSVEKIKIYDKALTSTEIAAL